MRTTLIIEACVAFCVMMNSTNVSALPPPNLLPPASYVVSLDAVSDSYYNSGSSFPESGVAFYDDGNNNFAQAQATVTISPAPTISYYGVETSFGSVIDLTADITLKYYFEAIGPSGEIGATIGYAAGANIPDYFAYSADLTENTAAVFINVHGPGVNYYYATGAESDYSNQTNTTAFSLAGTPSFMLQADAPYEIGIQLQVSTLGDTEKYVILGSSGGVDPIITLMGPDESLYTLVLSQGVGNSLTASVPETDTWICVTAGFATLAFFKYRERKFRHPSRGCSLSAS